MWTEVVKRLGSLYPLMAKTTEIPWRHRLPKGMSTMKVNELICLLGNLDGDAEVYLANQPSYPIEHSVRGVVVRRDFTKAEDEEDGGNGPGARPTDVLLLEGGWARYGDGEAWRKGCRA